VIIAMARPDFRYLLRAFDRDPERAPDGSEVPGDPLLAAWRGAAATAHAAYETWLYRRDGDSYAGYRAAADRLDAAQDVLAARAAHQRGG
jgi:hypothetical protein